MNVISSVEEIKKAIRKVNHYPAGMVPTMGALHDGHISLVEKAVSECPLVVISIYVNPTQFNDKKDLVNYPRTTDADLSLLSNYLRKEDIVFTPSDKEIYPEPDTRKFSFGNLDNVMEAVQRPGHFNGVAQVVSRLFEIVSPDVAYFGIKDFQQVAVIKSLARQLRLPVRIIECPIVREPDGLAMSSRNRLLEKSIRKKAPVIYSAISEASRMLLLCEISEIRKYVRETIEKEKDFKVEYFEIVDDTDLIPVSRKAEMSPGKRYYGCIAVRAGKIRLIDNIEMSLA